jgi:hypothetical protein
MEKKNYFLFKIGSKYFDCFDLLLRGPEVTANGPAVDAIKSESSSCLSDRLFIDNFHQHF